jgi:hypothetical protein
MYRDICREFGYDEDEDARSAEALSALLSTRQVPTADELSAGCPETVTVCGDGPLLAEEISASPPAGYVVAADGATEDLMDAGIVPDAIVTDLDGDVQVQIRASAKGSLVFVHAHGDNQDEVRAVVPRMKGRVVGTCQGPPHGGLLNLGGFTDGDRAACIFSGLGARTVVLVGFDFERPSEKASRPPEVKRRKLAWARRILESLAADGVRIEGL